LRFYAIAEEDAEVGVEELVLTLPGGPYQEYFALSLPVSTTIAGVGGITGTDWKEKRFIYAHDSTATTTATTTAQQQQWRFPMQLGTEIAAAIMNEPQKAFWKNQVVDEETEKSLSASFKSKFNTFDFTA